MMLCIDRFLHVSDHPTAWALWPSNAHRDQSGYLLVLGLYHLTVQSVQPLNLLAQRRNLLI